MSRIKEKGKYICYIAKAEKAKKVHCPDIVLIPYKKYLKKYKDSAKETRLKFVKYSKKNKTVTFKITKRNGRF